MRISLVNPSRSVTLRSFQIRGEVITICKRRRAPAACGHATDAPGAVSHFAPLGCIRAVRWTRERPHLGVAAATEGPIVLHPAQGGMEARTAHVDGALRPPRRRASLTTCDFQNQIDRLLFRSFSASREDSVQPTGVSLGGICPEQLKCP